MKNVDMRSSWLVQRLDPPDGFANPFAFGGGGSGLTASATEVLRSVWSFDYMGAAEFEFGAAPKALDRIIKSKPIAFQLDLARPVYVIGPKAWRGEITQRLNEWSKGPVRMKESMRFAQALAGEEHVSTVGWLELDNGFLFFIDETMWQRSCDLFGVKAPVS